MRAALSDEFARWMLLPEVRDRFDQTSDDMPSDHDSLRSIVLVLALNIHQHHRLVAAHLLFAFLNLNHETSGKVVCLRQADRNLGKAFVDWLKLIAS